MIPEAPQSPPGLLEFLNAAREREALPAPENVEVDHPASVAEVSRLMRERASDEGYKLAAFANDYALSEATFVRLMGEIVQPRWAAERGAASEDQLRDWYAHAREYSQNGFGAKVERLPVNVYAHIIAETDAGAPITEIAPAPVLRFKVQPWPTFLNEPEPDWLLPERMPAHGVAMIYGAPLSYKTFAVADLALAISTGLPRWGFPAHTASHVVYCAGEGDRAFKTKRLAAWAYAHNQEPTTRFGLVSRVPKLRDPEDLIRFTQEVRSQGYGRPEVIVIDTLAKAMVGMDESKPADLAVAIERLYDLAAAFGCLVIVIHHTNKDGATYRGASNLLGDLDAVLRVEADRQAKVATVTWEKVKDAEMPPPLTFKAHGVLNSVVLDPISAEDARERQGDRGNEKGLVAALREVGGGPEKPRVLASIMCRDVEEKHQLAMIEQVEKSLKKRARTSLRPYVFGTGDPLMFFLPDPASSDTVIL